MASELDSEPPTSIQLDREIISDMLSIAIDRKHTDEETARKYLNNNKHKLVASIKQWEARRGTPKQKWTIYLRFHQLRKPHMANMIWVIYSPKDQSKFCCELCGSSPRHAKSRLTFQSLDYDLCCYCYKYDIQFHKRAPVDPTSWYAANPRVPNPEQKVKMLRRRKEANTPRRGLNIGTSRYLVKRNAQRTLAGLRNDDICDLCQHGVLNRKVRCLDCSTWADAALKHESKNDRETEPSMPFHVPYGSWFSSENEADDEVGDLKCICRSKLSNPTQRTTSLAEALKVFQRRVKHSRKHLPKTERLGENPGTFSSSDESDD